MILLEYFDTKWCKSRMDAYRAKLTAFLIQMYQAFGLGMPLFVHFQLTWR